jgi:23S rRNA pseudouridine1911/1915/1917 synthase
VGAVPKSSPAAFGELVLYEDNHLLAIQKPAGILVQGDATGDESLLDLAKAWLIEKYQKPGQAFLGLLHRLDRPVGGVVVFAKTSKAAARLSQQFRERTVGKTYLAVAAGRPPASGELVHYLKRSGKRRVSVAHEAAADRKQAELSYRLLGVQADWSLLEVQIKTGRHHQIRVQLASSGYVIAGDRKYGSRVDLAGKGIALFSRRIEFDHPVSGARMAIAAEPPAEWPWTLFAADLQKLRAGET